MKKITAIVGSIAALSGAAYAGHRISRYQDRETTVYLAETEIARPKAQIAPSPPAPVSSIVDPFPIYPLRVLETLLKAKLSRDPKDEWKDMGEGRSSAPAKKRGLFIPCAETAERTPGSRPRKFIIYLPNEKAREKFLNAALNFYRMNDRDTSLTLDINVTDARQAFHFNPRESENFYPVEMKPRIEVAIPGMSGDTPIVAVYDDRWLDVNEDIGSVDDVLGLTKLESGPIPMPSPPAGSPGSTTRSTPSGRSGSSPEAEARRHDREAYRQFRKNLAEVEKIRTPEDAKRLVLTLYTWTYTGH